MRSSAIVFTSITVAFGVLAAAVPGEQPVVADPPSACINWVPTSSVQLSAASLAAEKAPPTPAPDVVPHPDKEKCPCKGTGVIVHGDGHKTECPYHGADAPEPPNRKCSCDQPGFFCACDEKYGECRCPTVEESSQADCDDTRGRSSTKSRPRGGLFDWLLRYSKRG